MPGLETILVHMPLAVAVSPRHRVSARGDDEALAAAATDGGTSLAFDGDASPAADSDASPAARPSTRGLRACRVAFDRRRTCRVAFDRHPACRVAFGRLACRVAFLASCMGRDRRIKGGWAATGAQRRSQVDRPYISETRRQSECWRGGARETI
mmetsp:Transcript_26900/g.82763  ORF Transcript_26900/g.82763 Transcript_26900/m.82763 type:complete len:154 (-) Transcript_26900:84-545(-)